MFLLIFLALSSSFPALLNKASSSSFSAYAIAPHGNNEYGFLLYRNTTLGISMNYPSSWKKIDQKSAGEKTFVTFAQSQALFSRLVIEIDSLTSKNSTLRNPHIVGTNRSAILAHLPAHKAIYREYEPYLVPGGQIKSMDIYTFIDNKAYHIIYKSELSKFKTYLPVVEKMINSFKITNK
jgi:hypothetical protein